jgi:hypothetical protein
VRPKHFSKSLLQFFTELPDSLLAEMGAKEVTEGPVVPMAQDHPGKVIAIEGNLVFVQQGFPFPHVERVAVYEDAVHIKDRGSR